MPDYEIRYYHADDSLAVVQMTVQPSEHHAREHARENQRDHARFELRAAVGDHSPRQRR